MARASLRSLLTFGAVVVAFFLIAEHRAHTLGVLPYLLLLACPILHLFWHGRHGGHSHGDPERRSLTAGQGIGVGSAWGSAPTRQIMGKSGGR